MGETDFNSACSNDICVMDIIDWLTRIHTADPSALPGGPAAAKPEQTRLVLAAFHAVRQALNQCSADDRISVPGLGQFRLRNDQAATAAGASRRLVLAPEQSTRTNRVDQAAWQRALRARMLPLIHPRHRFVVLFFAKSACTSVVIWYLHTMGLLEGARSYSRWPHDFRIDRLYKRAEDREARASLRMSQVTVLKVVRDPLERAVSSFRHALATGYARESILAALGIDTAARGLSFERFIDFLEREDLQACDPHHALQWHPVERLRRPDVVINVSRGDLFAGLNDFERRLGMPVTDFSALRWIHELQASREAPTGETEGDTYRQVLTQRHALQGPWPRTLLTSEARRRLGKLYARDLRADEGADMMQPAESTPPRHKEPTN